MADGVEEALEPVFLMHRFLLAHPLKADFSLSYPWLTATILAMTLPCLLWLYCMIRRLNGGGISSDFYNALRFFQCLMILSSSLVSTFEFTKNSHRYHAVKIQLMECDDFLKRLQYPVDYNDSYAKQYIIMFYFFFFSLAVSEVLTETYDKLFCVFGLYYYPMAVSWTAELLFVSFIKIISIQSIKLRQNLRKLNPILLEQLVFVYYRLMTLSYALNDMMSWSILINMANHFISLSLNSNHVTLVIERRDYLQVVKMFSFIFFHLVASFMVVEASEGVSKQGRRFIKELEAVMIKSQDNHFLKNERLHSIIRIKKTFEFNAKRFFNLDHQFYLSMISMAFSYFILLFQITSRNSCDGL